MAEVLRLFVTRIDTPIGKMLAGPQRQSSSRGPEQAPRAAHATPSVPALRRERIPD